MIQRITTKQQRNSNRASEESKGKYELENLQTLDLANNGGIPRNLGKAYCEM